MGGANGTQEYVQRKLQAGGGGESGGRFTAFDLENERLANMFQAWVYDYIPLLNDENPTTRRGAWAMYTFMTGQVPPTDVNIDLTGNTSPIGNGFMYWISNEGG
jgi:hypothetical protein